MKSGESSHVWLGVDLGGTKIQATVFNREFAIVGRGKRKTKGQDGAKNVIGRIWETIEKTLAEAGLAADAVGGVGIGCPGPVDLDGGIVREAVNLQWKNVPLAEMMSKLISCPVAVLNDVDAGVYGEYTYGAAQGARTVLGIFPGTGIGGGCVMNGQIVRGTGTSAMEVGHIQVVHDGRLCGCGLRGCLETEASRLAIAAEAIQAAYRGEAPHLYAEVGTDMRKIRSGTLARAIKAGDAVVEEIVRQAAEKLGRAIGGLVHLVAPDVIVLGGGLVEALPKLYLSTVTKAAKGQVMRSYRDSFRVVAAQLGDDATAYGAAAWSRQMTGEFSTTST